MGRTHTFLCVLVVSACASPEIEFASTHAAVNGPADMELEWTGVVGMQIEKPEGVASCTGVLIAPNLLLTARHCVSLTAPRLICGEAPLSDPVEPMGILSTNDIMVQASSLAVRATRVEVPPDGNDECGFDIAAVVLAAEVPDSEVYPPRLREPVETGETFTAVGYGTSATGGIGTRRTLGEVAVRCVGGDDCTIPEVQATEWVADDDAFCRSDSGAPAIDVDGQVIGIVSKGINPCSTPVLSSIYAWREWLRGVGTRAAESGGYPPPTWTMVDSPDAGPGDAGASDSGPAADAGTDATVLLDAATDDAGPASIAPTDTGGCTLSVGNEPNAWMLILGLLLWVRRRSIHR